MQANRKSLPGAPDNQKLREGVKEPKAKVVTPKQREAISKRMKTVWKRRHEK